MPRLVIAVTFMGSDYHGVEWPPSPLRLYQAIFAGVMTGGNRKNLELAREILGRIEKMDPPEIIACDPQRSVEYAYALSVPNNDLDVAATAWRRGEAFDATILNTLKQVSPWQLNSIGPHVCYSYRWPDESVIGDAESLRSVIHCLHTLGWGVDMASADAAVIDDEQAEKLRGVHWTPVNQNRGVPYSFPVTGTLEDLEATYIRYVQRSDGNGVDPNTRPTVYGVQSYQRRGEIFRSSAKFTLGRLDGRGEFAKDWSDTMVVSAWLRHVTAEALRAEGETEDLINRYILGHSVEDRSDRVSYLPIPSIGSQYSDGRIRRVMIIEPAARSGRVSTLLRRRLPTTDVTDDYGNLVCRLDPNDDSQTVWQFYLHRGRLWQTVTPVILHGHNTDRKRFSLAKTEKLVLQALAESGYPEQMIETFTFQPAPFWPGTRGARQIRVPKHLEKWPRYHLAVRFREDISGPVFAGIGRHYGIGLFACAKT